MTGEKKVNPELKYPSINHLERDKTKYQEKKIILSYKLSVNILLEPVKVDIKRIQTQNKTVRKLFCFADGSGRNMNNSPIY